MVLTYILFFLGFVMLIKGADFLVDGASSAARHLGVSALAIGLTVVAFGTSAPELVVNLISSFQGNTDIAIGNILGSNIANILLILGITSVIYPLRVKKGTVWKEIPLALLAVLVAGLLSNDSLVDGRTFSEISRIDGFILLSFLIIFLYYVFNMSKDEEAPTAVIHRYSHKTTWIMIGGGLVGLAVGGKWVIDGAVVIAESFGVSEAIIGLSVVAFGTSLPELATSVVAALKRHTDIAVGNVVGSNILNIFWILGASAVVKPLPFSPIFLTDIFMATLATLLLFIFMFVGKNRLLERPQGIGFIAIYAIYIVFLFIR